MPDTFEYSRGNSPLLISFPHDGSEIPSHIKARLNETGKSNRDVDWFVSELYTFIYDMDISHIKPYFSRYVVDLNRSPAGELLYPGKMETAICPLTDFNNDSIYLKEEEPDKEEIQSRINTYWRPYHKHIQDELERIKKIHGYAILWDAHSIPGEVPILFEGQLPDLNFGTANGNSCHASLVNELMNIAGDNSKYSVVLNERFKGGYITRHYGDPENNIHSLQLEINQNNYLSEPSTLEIDTAKARSLSTLLLKFIQLLSTSSVKHHIDIE